MATFPFQANVAHARNIRRACTARHANEMSKHLGVDHMPCLKRAKSSDARLDTLGVNYELYKETNQTNLNYNQSKSENSVAKLSRSPSTENVVSAFSRPEEWNLTIGSKDGGFKLNTFVISSNGNLNNR
jgi:hypothetical protein